MCYKRFIWIQSNCECQCDKSSDVGEYLDYQNYKCRKKLVDELVEECTETVEEVKLVKITSAKEGKNKYKSSSCTLYIMLFSVTFTTNVGIGSYFLYLHWYLKKDITCLKFGTRTKITIWLLIL